MGSSVAVPSTSDGQVWPSGTGRWTGSIPGSQLHRGRVGVEAVGDGAQGLAHHEEDEVWVAASPDHPFGHRGDSVSHEIEDAGGEVPGERDLLGGSCSSAGSSWARVRSAIAGTSMGCWPRPRAGYRRRRGHLVLVTSNTLERFLCD
jgi:hypothetical protein